LFELLVERYEDLFEADPEALREASKNEDGELVFEETGDELIDKWERELALGLDPDLTEGLSKDMVKNLEKNSEKAKRAREIADGIDDSNILDQVLGSGKELDILRDNILGNGRNVSAPSRVGRRR
jgi:hypothetical protein